MRIQPVKTAVVGCGSISDVYFRNMIGKHPELEVVSCCAKGMESAIRQGKKYGVRPQTFEEILEDPEVEMLVILTPAPTHFDLIRRGLSAGKHVYTEKPIATTVEEATELIRLAVKPLLELALGGTAVGTGLNAPEGFDKKVAEEVAALTGMPFVTAPNKFHALTSKDELVFAHGAVKATAADMMKIANDVRWLASGPRCGLGEIRIPENEPGSSIMPGKVNPTQCEQVTMVAVQVMGNDTAISFAASQGNFELNVFMPVMAYNFLQSVRLLSESIQAFRTNCAEGIQAIPEKMHDNLHHSLMLVTALNPYIGYENAAKTAKYAFRENCSLKEACVALGFLSEERFDEVFHPEEMAGER